MKIRVLGLLVLTGIIMNGCLADRIKQRIYMKKMQQERVAHQIQKNKKRDLKATQSSQTVENFDAHPKDVKAEEVVVEKQKRVQSYSKPKYKTKREQKKAPTLSTGENSKSNKRVTKKNKKRKTKVKKMVREPYSIGNHKTDPELLGPQTTLKTNPLAKM